MSGLEMTFYKIMEMGLIGSYSIVVVLLARLLLMRCGRKYAYYLWFIAFLNLCIPFAWKSNFSLIPGWIAEPVIGEVITLDHPWGELAGEQNSADHQRENVLTGDGQGATVKPVQTGVAQGGTADGTQTDGSLAESTQGGLTDGALVKADMGTDGRGTKIACVVWLGGILVIGVLTLKSTLLIRKQIGQEAWIAWDEKHRIAIVEGIGTPFLWGLIHPIIYLPGEIEAEEMRYICAHESYHRKRKDYLVKLLVFLVVTVHWVNPLVWLAFCLFCRDMEISCDEAVLQRSNLLTKKQYAESLLKYAAMQNGYLLSPLAFGEPAVSARIKNILKFRKKGIVISAIAVVCVLGIVAGLLLRPGENAQEAGSGNAPEHEVMPEKEEAQETVDGEKGTANQPENGAPQDDVTSAPSYYGRWQVQNFYPLKGITGMSTEGAEGYMGFRCEYEENSFSCADGVWTIGSPDYQEEEVSKEDFAAGWKNNYTFESLGLEGDSITRVSVENADDFGSNFYVKDENTLLISYNGVFFEATRMEKIVLTEEGKAFLQKMCLYMQKDFTGYADISQDFLKDFLFNSYTSNEDVEYIRMYREDYGFEEGTAKVDRQTVHDYVTLVFGEDVLTEEYEAAYAENPRQSSFFYEDGYYYIGNSDFPDLRYDFRRFTLHEERYATYAFVEFDVFYESQATGESIIFSIDPADNENGFVIRWCEHRSQELLK